MRRLHLWMGGLTVLTFVITGQVLKHHQPPLATLSESARLMFRSRHIYILASGLVNLMLGLYLAGYPAGWRGVTRMMGSWLVIASAALLLAAFTVEPERGFQEEMWWSSAGLYALFGGSMLHVISARQVPASPDPSAPDRR